MAGNSENPDIKKGPDQRAPQESTEDTGNLALFLAKFQAVKAPQPTQPITPEQGACLLQLVNLATEGRPAPGVVAWLDLDAQAAEDATQLCLNIGEVTFAVSVAGWRPVFQTDARAHAVLADACFQAAVPLDDARACVQDMKPERTMLNDERRFRALELLGEAEKSLSTSALAMLEDIGNPVHWINPIPETATLTGTWWAIVKRGRK